MSAHHMVVAKTKNHGSWKVISYLHWGLNYGAINYFGLLGASGKDLVSLDRGLKYAS